MNNLLENNIFFKMNKNKFNPDINIKNEEIKNERNEIIFKKSTTTYNSITNQIPENIKSQKDLELDKDKPITNLKDIILNKAKERMDQEQLFKPIKQKILMNTENNNTENNIENNNEPQNFNDLKIDQTIFNDNQQVIINNNKNKYENILKNLKSLGILDN